MMDGQGKSDRLIVPRKATNKARELVAEALEGRSLAKGNPKQRDTDRTQCRERVSSALERVRRAARREKGVGLLPPVHHHSYSSMRLGVTTRGKSPVR